MFWNAVNEGLAMFTHWETWVCIVVWLMVTGLPRLLVFRAVAGPKESRHIGGIYLMLTPFIQAISMSLLILTLSPLIFGLGDQAAWRFPWSMMVDAPGPTLKMIVAVFVAWLLSRFTPYLNGIAAYRTCFVGIAALVFGIRLVNTSNAVPVLDRVALWPGYAYALGGLAIGAVVVLCANRLAAWLGKRAQSEPGVPRGTALFGIEGVLGLVPVFIYGAWLGEQM